jgi:ubiquinone/menaquinone biosynthesis C-methylase UbiE
MNEFGKGNTKIEKLKIRQPTCPWWFLFTFDNPLRKIYQDPLNILSPYINVGDTVVDLGCGMGYFSIPMAELVGDRGKVIAVDLQERMLAGLRGRAEKANLLERIKTHRCAQDKIGISEEADFVLAFWMVHEVHNSRSFLEQIGVMLKAGGRLLIAEPYIHVSRNKFQEIKSQLDEVGFSILGYPAIGYSRSILVEKDH